GPVRVQAACPLRPVSRRGHLGLPAHRAAPEWKMLDYERDPRVVIPTGERGVVACALRSGGLVRISVCLRPGCYAAGECSCDSIMEAPLVPGHLLEPLWPGDGPEGRGEGEA